MRQTRKRYQFSPKSRKKKKRLGNSERSLSKYSQLSGRSKTKNNDKFISSDQLLGRQFSQFKNGIRTDLNLSQAQDSYLNLYNPSNIVGEKSPGQKFWNRDLFRRLDSITLTKEQVRRKNSHKQNFDPEQSLVGLHTQTIDPDRISSNVINKVSRLFRGIIPQQKLRQSIKPTKQSKSALDQYFQLNERTLNKNNLRNYVKLEASPAKKWKRDQYPHIIGKSGQKQYLSCFSYRKFKQSKQNRFLDSTH